MRAVQCLRGAGFSGDEIGVAARDVQEQHEVAAEAHRDGSGEAQPFLERVSHVFGGVFGDGREQPPSGPDDLSATLQALNVPRPYLPSIEQGLLDGDVLITVHTSLFRGTVAETVLLQCGGRLGAQLATPADSVGDSGQHRIHLLGEVLRVHRQRSEPRRGRHIA